MSQCPELRDVSLHELPCGMPLVMMTWLGDTLLPQKAPFVELIGTSDNHVTIQKVEDKWQRGRAVIRRHKPHV